MFMGDTGIDIKTGLSAGMVPTGALWGFRTAAELTNAGAAALLSSPHDAYDFFT
jgi:phosphoglycolate phosphatase